MRVKEKLKITDYGNARKEFGQEERCPEPRVPNDQIGAKAAVPRLHRFINSGRATYLFLKRLGVSMCVSRRPTVDVVAQYLDPARGSRCRLAYERAPVPFLSHKVFGDVLELAGGQVNKQKVHVVGSPPSQIQVGGADDSSCLALEGTASEEYSTTRFGCLELDGGVEMTLAVGAKSGPM